MGSKRVKWKDDHVCMWCFEPMDRFILFYCSDHCKEEAERYKVREDSLGKSQRKAKNDLDKHNAEIRGDSPDDYPLNEDNLND